jgi:hypothetical protein
MSFREICVPLLNLQLGRQTRRQFYKVLNIQWHSVNDNGRDQERAKSASVYIFPKNEELFRTVISNKNPVEKPSAASRVGI